MKFRKQEKYKTVLCWIWQRLEKRLRWRPKQYGSCQIIALCHYHWWQCGRSDDYKGSYMKDSQRRFITWRLKTLPPLKPVHNKMFKKKREKSSPVTSPRWWMAMWTLCFECDGTPPLKLIKGAVDLDDLTDGSRKEAKKNGRNLQPVVEKSKGVLGNRC